MSGLILAYQGKSPRIADGVYIAPGAAVIGDVEIGAGSSVWFNAVLRGDVREIRVGERTNIQDGTVIHVTSFGSGAYLGSDITVGHSAVIHACTIEDHCLIGMNATVLDGVVVESWAIVAAGSVVPPGKRVKSGELWSGNPAKTLRSLTGEETDFIRRSAERYCGFAGAYLEAAK